MFGPDSVSTLLPVLVKSNAPPIGPEKLKFAVPSPWNGVLAPANTPPEIIARLHQALSQIVADPALKRTLAKVGAETMTATPQQFAAIISKDYALWSGVIKHAGITAE